MNELAPLVVLLIAAPLTIKILRWYVLGVHEPRDKARVDTARIAREQATRAAARNRSRS